MHRPDADTELLRDLYNPETHRELVADLALYLG
jgi:hypothetical protein